jgi:signal transduction histidine kinase
VEDQLPFESELIARTGWLIRLRWVAVIGTALAVGLAALWFPDRLALGPLIAITAAIALYNLLFAFYLRSLKRGHSEADRLRQATRSATLQIVMDMVALATLLHFSGGLENPMALFFVFHVIIASILLRAGVSYVMAGLATALLSGVAILESAGILRHYHLPFSGAERYREPLYLLVTIAGLALALFLVAYLTTSIVIRLRERDRLLLESNQICQFSRQDLKALNEQLRRIDNERTRFMMLVTHELRAPVSTIYAALDLALSGLATPEKEKDVLQRAQNRASELLELISDLLDLSKVREETALPNEVTPIQLEEPLRSVVEFMQVEADVKGLSLDVDVAPDLAPVRARFDQMKLVWTNLISNAIKYSPEGGSVWISLNQDEEHVIGVVCDSGIGIAPKDLPHVFDEFFRASNARQVSPHGTGVGLAIVQRTIEHWGGSITVESKVGQGTTFRFALPRADAYT